MEPDRHEIRIVNTRPEYADALAEIQRLCFPALADNERLKAEHYHYHLKLFPEGQFTALSPDGHPVASSADFRTRFDFLNIEHRFRDAIADGWLSNHDPRGDWLYGADISVHPEWQGKGIGKLLYACRRDLIRKLKLRGHIAGGFLMGYGRYKESMSVEAYVARVVRGELWDPALSVQLRNGFKVQGIIQNYMDDPTCNNKAALIVWTTDRTFAVQAAALVSRSKEARTH